MKRFVIAAPLCALLLGSGLVGRELRQDSLDRSLTSAIKRRQTQQAIALLREGASSNAVYYPYAPLSPRSLMSTLLSKLRGKAAAKQGSLSALMLACTMTDDHSTFAWPADPSLLRALLSSGADPNTSIQDYSALDTQVECGPEENVRILLENGADPNRIVGYPPLLSAIVRGDIPAADVLLRYGAKTGTGGYCGYTALDSAVVNGRANVEMLNLILSHDPKTNERGSDGITSLMYAVSHGPMIVSFLLKHGADASLRDKLGYSALDRAVSLPNSPEKESVIRLLTASLHSARAASNSPQSL